MNIKDYQCQICENKSLRKIDIYSDLIRVTSDCRPFKKGGVLTVCEVCGAVQKINNANWRKELKEIYSKYFAYHQSGGEEQKVFDSKEGIVNSRSNVVVNRLKDYISSGQNCELLDIGCGNGVTLKAFSNIFPQWVLNGFEIGDEHLSTLNKIKKFNKLYNGDIGKINNKFELISMVHSLEHFQEPKKILKEIAKNLSTNHLFIEVCNIEDNPFDVLVADHLMHFSPETLERLVVEAGFSVTAVETNWIPKEISMLCKVGAPLKGSFVNGHVMRIKPSQIYEKTTSYVMWLRQLVQSADNLIALNGPIGIFGSSIAATWLASQLIGNVKFFVDEDSSRIGREHLGLPIISPDAAPKSSSILIPLAPKIADAIYLRLKERGGKYVLPPELI